MPRVRIDSEEGPPIVERVRRALAPILERARHATRPHPGTRAAWDRNDITAVVYVALVAYLLGGGITILTGGPEGVSTPSFAVIRDHLDHIGWGALMVTLGVLALAGVWWRPRAVAAAFAGTGLLYLLLASGVYAAVKSAPERPPYPAPIGVGSYLLIAVIYAASSVPYWGPRRSDRRTLG